MKRRLIITALALAILAIAFLAAGRALRPRAIAQVGGDLPAPPLVRGGWVAWMEAESGRSHLMVAPRRGGKARRVLSAPALSGLALDGNTAFLTRTEATSGGSPRTELLRLDLPRGEPITLAEAPAPAHQTVSGDGWLCWREDRPADLRGVPFVVAGAGASMLRAVPVAGGDVVSVAALTPEPSLPGAGTDLLGIVRGYAYWLERRGLGAGATSIIRRAELPGGEPQVVARERGWRSAALTEEALLWTAPSLESSDPNQFSAVMRLPHQTLQPEPIGDWLGRDAVLLTWQHSIYARDVNHVWRLGDTRGRQRPVARRLQAMLSGGIAGDQEYLLIRSGDRRVIVKRPLTVWARLRNLL